MTSALIDWISHYPGDLQDPQAQALYRKVLAIALKHAFMGHLVADLVRIEQTLTDVIDIDASWSIQSPRGIPPIAPKLNGASHPELSVDGEIPEGSVSQSEIDTPTTRGVTTPSRQSSSMSSLGVDIAATPVIRRKRSGWERFASSETTEKSRPNGLPSVAGSSSLDKASAFVLDSEYETVAVELSRMQWELYNAIRVGHDPMSKLTAASGCVSA